MVLFLFLQFEDDDEICSQIRLIQSQLQDKRNTNNERRQDYLQRALKRCKDREIPTELLRGGYALMQLFDNRRVILVIIKYTKSTNPFFRRPNRTAAEKTQGS